MDTRIFKSRKKISILVFLFISLFLSGIAYPGTYQFTIEWGSPGTGNSQFDGPWGVAVDTSGNVYVVDSVNYRIQKFDSNGSYLTQWGSLGTGNGQFNNPTGVAVDTSGNVYVADSGNYRIQKFDSNGNYLTQWGSHGTGNGQFNNPTGVALDTFGNVYVVDSYLVQKFDSDGIFITQWGSFGVGDGQFYGQMGVAVDTPGNVFVTDFYFHPMFQVDRIQKFDSAGNFITKWGSYGTGNGQFSTPFGAAIDIFGDVYVVDMANNRIQKFDSDGNYITQWGSHGTGNGQFNNPFGAAVDTFGNVFVTDYGNNRIQKFAPVTWELLNDLYDSLGGATWTNKTGWNGPAGTECTWYGVTCDGSNNVTQLNLSGNNLSGTIPSSIGNLTNLQILNFANNHLSGSIPAELGNLSNLQALYLYNNQLSGPIPASLGSLSNLTDLLLFNNQLSGPIPTELGNLANLQTLYLDSNQLSESIPTSLGSLSHLTYLGLHDNLLSGSIPTSFGSLSNLQALYLYNNQLSGSIPTSLGFLSNLTYLILFNNQLSGSIPTSLGSLSNLTYLSLYNNQLSGSIPAELGSLSNLQVLYLYHNQLSGPIPSELGNLINLQNLGLSNNPLSGTIPIELGSLSNLLTLTLEYDQLTGTVPASLGSLSNLTYLSLLHNQLSGPMPASLGSLTNLTYLNLGENQLTGPIPTSFGNLTNLQRLYLNSNQLSGFIPASLGNLTELTDLGLHNNQLSGSIPTELGNLTNLRYLLLYSNQLTGAIPSELSNLINLLYNQSDIRWNALYTSDSTLRTFLNSKQIGGNWESTQTIAPTNLTVTVLSPTSVKLKWTPIAYTDGTGSYEIWKGTSNGTIWTLEGTTQDKSINTYTVNNLTPGTVYAFKLRTVTNPILGINQNTVYSEYIPFLLTAAIAAGGVYNTAQTVNLTQIIGQPDSIYYTTNGIDPTTSSTLYTAPFQISTNTTLKFFAVAGGSQEAVKTEVYTINSNFGGSLPPVTNAIVNGPIPVTATFSNNTGSDVITIKPDCFNTYFEVKDPQDNLLPSFCRIRTAYGPNDIFTLAANSSITISCNLADMYDPSILSSLAGGTYPLQATYSNYIQDNNLVGPNGESINWTGAIVATPAQINLSPTLPPLPYTLTYTAGTGGSISGITSQTVDSGGNGTEVTAVANIGYYFVNWSDGVPTASRTDSNVKGNIAVTANFAINTYTLTYTAGAGGTIQGMSPQTVNYNASGSLVTAVPNPGYYFVNWSDGVLTASRTDTNVKGNISVTANFAKIYTFTGFFPPVANPNVLNSVQAGQTVPIKWQIADSNGWISDPTLITGITFNYVTCNANAPSNPIPDDADTFSSTGLQYEGNGNWQFNWKTYKGDSGKCVSLNLKLKDGTTYTANFQFKK